METKSYEDALKIIESRGENEEEKKVNKLFLEMGFDFVDCDVTFSRNNQNVGQIDGIFSLKDEYLFLIEIDKLSSQDSSKVGKFFTKWEKKENLSEILNKYKIQSQIKIMRIYTHCNVKKPKENFIKESLKHFQSQEDNKFLYKEDIEYYLESFSIIGPWAKNELLHSFNLKFKKISEERDAIRISMSGKRAFLFSATAEELLNASYIYRKNEYSLGGYQRILKANRVNSIKSAIEKKKILAFPNSIIVSSHIPLESGYATESKAVKIRLPTSYLSFKVVDGQHRLMGFAKLSEKEQKEHYLPVVAFEDLDKEKELGTFITINTEQKNIDPNLLLILKADMDWEETEKFYIDKQITLICKKLNDDINFFLKDRIFLGYNNPKKGKITLTTLVGAIKKNNLVCGKLHLLQERVDEVDSPTKEIKRILNSVKSNFEGYCDLKKPSKVEGFFLSNRGLRIIFRLVQFLIRNNKKKNVEIEYEDFFSDISNCLSKQDIEDLMENYGEGGANNATEKILTKLKKQKNEKYKKFVKKDFKKL